MARTADDYLGPPLADDYLDGAPAQPAASPWIKWPAVVGSAAVRGLDIGLGTPGDLVALGEHYAPELTRGVNDVTSTFGLPIEMGGKPTLPSSDFLTNKTNALGLTGTQLGTPASPAQRVVAGGVAGASAALPFALTGDLPGALAVGGAAGTAAGGMNELLPDNPAVSTATGLITGLATHSLGTDVKNALALRSALKAQTLAKQGLAQAKEASVTGREGAAAAAQAKIDAARNAATSARTALTPHTPPYEALAAKFSPTQTLQEAGEGLQDAGRKWLSVEMPKRQAAAWEPVDKMISPSAEIELPEYAGALSNITAKGARLGGPLKSPIFDNLNSRLKAALTPIEEIPGEAPKVKPLTWTDARQLRTLIGDAMADPTTVKPIHQQDLANLYRALTKDMGARAQAIGPEAGKAFNTANASSQRLFDFAEGPLAKVVSGKGTGLADNPRPEDVARRLVTSGRSGATDLSALRAEFPDQINGVTASFLRQQGKAWSNLAPEAKVALTGSEANAKAVDAALAKHAQDQAAFNLAHKTLSGALTDARAAAAASQRGTRAQLQSAQRNAQRGLDKANQQYEAAKAARGESGHNLLGGILGGTVGPEAAIAIMHSLGLPGSELLHGAWGGLMGAVAPWAVRSLGRTIKAPKGPLTALQGARGGSAATTGRP